MAVWGSASVLGPVVGGFLAGQASVLGIDGWRWIFLVNVPLGALALAIVSRVLHLPHERREHRIDWPGALALSTSVVPLLVVAEQGRTWGWTSTAALACSALGAVGLVLFVLAERAYGDDALLPLRLFGNRSFTVAALGSVVLGAGMLGGLLLLPQYLQIVHGSSATVAGLQMLPLVAGIMAGAGSSGVVISKTGRYRQFPLLGVVLMATALTGLSAIAGTGTPYALLVPFLALFGVGVGFTFQPVVVAVQNAVSPREIGVATSSVAFFRQTGATVGAAAGRAAGGGGGSGRLLRLGPNTVAVSGPGSVRAGGRRGVLRPPAGDGPAGGVVDPDPAARPGPVHRGCRPGGQRQVLPAARRAAAPAGPAARAVAGDRK